MAPDIIFERNVLGQSVLIEIIRRQNVRATIPILHSDENRSFKLRKNNKTFNSKSDGHLLFTFICCKKIDLFC